MRALLLTIVCLGVACATSPPPAPVETPKPPPASPTPATPACALLVRTEVQPIGQSRFRVSAVAENATNAPLHFELPDRCPNGPVAFDGLGAAYDYYGTCNRGACPAEQPPHEFEIAAGAKQEIGSFVVDVRGEPPCTKLLPIGTYAIGVTMPEVGAPVCVTKGVLQVKADMLVPPLNPHPSPTPSRPLPPPKVSEQPPSDMHQCTQSSDCVLSCPTPAGCCSNPCGCKNAINRNYVTAYEKEVERTCTRTPHCPAYGCAYQPAFGAACDHGRCVATHGPSF